MTRGELLAACRAARVRVREAEARAELLSAQLAIVERHLVWRSTLDVLTDVTFLDAETLSIISAAHEGRS